MNIAAKYLRHVWTTRWLVAAGMTIMLGFAADRSHASEFTWVLCRDSAALRRTTCIDNSDSYWEARSCDVYYFQDMDYCARAS